jgi:hypothetical protein
MALLDRRTPAERKIKVNKAKSQEEPTPSAATADNEPMDKADGGCPLADHDAHVEGGGGGKISFLWLSPESEEALLAIVDILSFLGMDPLANGLWAMMRHDCYSARVSEWPPPETTAWKAQHLIDCGYAGLADEVLNRAFDIAHPLRKDSLGWYRSQLASGTRHGGLPTRPPFGEASPERGPRRDNGKSRRDGRP